MEKLEELKQQREEYFKKIGQYMLQKQYTVAKFDLKFIGDMLAFVVYHDVIVRDKYKHLVCSEVF